MSQPTPADPHQPTAPAVAQPTAPRRSWFARHKVLTGVGAFVALIVVVNALGGGDDEEPTDAAPAAAASADAGQPAPEEKEEKAAPAAEEVAAAGIGTPVRDGKFEFTVTGVEPGVASIGSDVFGETAQGQFLLVRMTVTNIGDEAQHFSGSNQELVDTEGRTHSADTSAAIYLDDSDSFLNQINPGNSVEGTVVFDIPTDATPASIELHDSMFSGGVSVTLG